MKRTVLTAVVLSLAAAAAFAQQKIQDTFFGLSFGQYYDQALDLRNIKEHISYSSLTSGDGWSRQHLQLYGMEFGGRRWDYADYYFSPGGCFYKFRVYEAYRSLEDADKRYVSLQKDLDLKYGDDGGIVMEEDDCMDGDREKSVTYTDADGRTCKLCVLYTESSSYDMYYYVMLYYYDRKFTDKAEAEFLEEL